MDKYFFLRRERDAALGLNVAELSENILDKLEIDADHGWTPKDRLLRSKAQIARTKSKSAFNRMFKKAERIMRT
ncbi:hypothetical protein R0K20_22850, partial [Staphylococcus sp. SIMBA_130]